MTLDYLCSSSGMTEADLQELSVLRAGNAPPNQLQSSLENLRHYGRNENEVKKNMAGHLLRCTSCTQAYNGYEQLHRSLFAEGNNIKPPSDDFRTTVLETITRKGFQLIKGEKK